MQYPTVEQLFELAACWRLSHSLRREVAGHFSPDPASQGENSSSVAPSSPKLLAIGGATRVTPPDAACEAAIMFHTHWAQSPAPPSGSDLLAFVHNRAQGGAACGWVAAPEGVYVFALHPDHHQKINKMLHASCHRLLIWRQRWRRQLDAACVAAAADLIQLEPVFAQAGVDIQLVPWPKSCAAALGVSPSVVRRSDPSSPRGDTR